MLFKEIELMMRIKLWRWVVVALKIQCCFFGACRDRRGSFSPVSSTVMATLLAGCWEHGFFSYLKLLLMLFQFAVERSCHRVFAIEGKPAFHRLFPYHPISFLPLGVMAALGQLKERYG